jgi:hypothetical protein
MTGNKLVDKYIISSDPRTQETELQVQKIINLQNIADNLPDAFIDYNDVMKSWNPTVNTPERMEVPKKITLTPSTKKRGRAETTRKDTASEKRPRKEKSKAPRKFNNVVQPKVEQHHLNVDDQQSSSQVRYTNEIRTSKIADNLVLGNHEASKGIDENSINYTSSGNVYDRNTTIADLCFSTIIAESFLNDPDPKTMVDCKKRSDWNKWKEAIEVELNSLRKRKVFTKVLLTPPRTFPVGFKWVFIQKR